MWGRPLPGAPSSSRMWWGWHRDSWGEGQVKLSPGIPRARGEGALLVDGPGLGQMTHGSCQQMPEGW